MLPEEQNRARLTKTWAMWAMQPNEAKTEQNCQVNQYLRGEFPQRIVDTIDGTRLGYFNATDGLKAMFYVHQSCAAEDLMILSATGESHAVYINISLQNHIGEICLTGTPKQET